MLAFNAKYCETIFESYNDLYLETEGVEPNLWLAITFTTGYNQIIF
jgi:hypothetical protein